MLILDPASRLGINDIKEIKRHPFFNGIDWETIRKSPAPIIPHQHLKNPTNFETRKKFDQPEQKEPFYQKVSPPRDNDYDEKIVIFMSFYIRKYFFRKKRPLLLLETMSDWSFLMNLIGKRQKMWIFAQIQIYPFNTTMKKDRKIRSKKRKFQFLVELYKQTQCSNTPASMKSLNKKPKRNCRLFNNYNINQILIKTNACESCRFSAWKTSWEKNKTPFHKTTAEKQNLTPFDTFSATVLEIYPFN